MTGNAAVSHTSESAHTWCGEHGGWHTPHTSGVAQSSDDCPFRGVDHAVGAHPLQCALAALGVKTDRIEIEVLPRFHTVEV